MKSGFRFVFTVICLTAVLIFTVYLRSVDNAVFYRLCKLRMQQNRLKQQLWHKQLQVENLINPAAAWQQLSEDKSSEN